MPAEGNAPVLSPPTYCSSGWALAVLQGVRIRNWLPQGADRVEEGGGKGSHLRPLQVPIGELLLLLGSLPAPKAHCATRS